MKSGKENFEETNRELKAKLENQPRFETFRFTKTLMTNLQRWFAPLLMVEVLVI
jgi:hypothetical protein